MSTNTTGDRCEPLREWPSRLQLVAEWKADGVKVERICWPDYTPDSSTYLRTDDKRELIYQLSLDGKWWVVEYCKVTGRIRAIHNPRLLETIIFEEGVRESYG